MSCSATGTVISENQPGSPLAGQCAWGTRILKSAGQSTGSYFFATSGSLNWKDEVAFAIDVVLKRALIFHKALMFYAGPPAVGCYALTVTVPEYQYLSALWMVISYSRTPPSPLLPLLEVYALICAALHSEPSWM